MTTLRGVYLPLVTPFLDGEVDLESLDRLLARYRGGVLGLAVGVDTASFWSWDLSGSAVLDLSRPTARGRGRRPGPAPPPRPGWRRAAW